MTSATTMAYASLIATTGAPMPDFEHTGSTLDVDTAVAVADDPDVELVDMAVDHNPDHGQNPELIEDGDER